MLPAVRAQDDVDAVTAQPGALVEAVAWPAAAAAPSRRLEHGALRRRAPERQLEQHRLAKAEPAEAAAPGAGTRSSNRDCRGGPVTDEQRCARRCRRAPAARCGRARRGARCPTTSRRAAAAPASSQGRPSARAASRRERDRDGRPRASAEAVRCAPSSRPRARGRAPARTACGEPRAAVTAPPGLAAARSASARFRERRRARRPS